MASGTPCTRRPPSITCVPTDTNPTPPGLHRSDTPASTSTAATAPPAAHQPPASDRYAPTDSGSCTNPRHGPTEPHQRAGHRLVHRRVVPRTNDRDCLEPAQPDLDLDVIHDGFPFPASARSADARRGCGGGVVGQGRRAAPGAASLDRTGPRPHKLGGLQRTPPRPPTSHRNAPNPHDMPGTRTNREAVRIFGSVVRASVVDLGSSAAGDVSRRCQSR
jgi:hypothetical protein